MNHAVLCKDLTREYTQGNQTVTALSSCTLTIEAGEFLCLSGPSGSGKSTLLHLCGALDRPTSGSVVIHGTSLDTLDEPARARLRLEQLGFIFQAHNLIPVLSAEENVGFILELQGRPRKEIQTRARDVLREVGLEGLESRRPSELSGGQQQRVAIARAIVARPRLVLADEPTANLDSTTSQRIIELMLSLNEHYAITFLFATHDPLMMQHAKRQIHLQDGIIIKETIP